MRKVNLKKGDKIRVPSGEIEEVMTAFFCEVTTYESFSRGEWYHPTKVFKINQAAAPTE